MTDRVFFCWSYPTVADLNRDGTADVIWGSEYNLPDKKTSSIHVFRTKAPATAGDWPLPFGNRHHWGREHKSSGASGHVVGSRR